MLFKIEINIYLIYYNDIIFLKSYVFSLIMLMKLITLFLEELEPEVTDVFEAPVELKVPGGMLIVSVVLQLHPHDVK